MDWHARVYAGGGGTTRTPRRKAPVAVKAAVWDRQGPKCLYCGLEFGTWVQRGRRAPIRLRVEWDHFRPYVFLLDNPRENWVASCQICNGIKSALVPTGQAMESLDAVKAVIAGRRARMGYTALGVSALDREG